MITQETKNQEAISEDAADEALAKLADAPAETPTATETPTEIAPVAAEKETAKKTKKKSKDDDIVEEKTYTIPLGKALIMPPRKRAPRAMHMIRAFVVKHMKVPTRPKEEDDEVPTISITNEVNEHVWGRGIEKPPRKVRVRITKNKDGDYTVRLAEAE
jgi:large subunit ribosomal protein L31e